MASRLFGANLLSGGLNCYVALKFDRYLNSSAAKVLIKFQSDSQTSQLQDFVRSYDETSYQVLKRGPNVFIQGKALDTIIRADSMFAPSQWETSLQSNVVSHWQGPNLQSALYHGWYCSLFIQDWEISPCFTWRYSVFLHDWMWIKSISSKSDITFLVCLCHNYWVM